MPRRIFLLIPHTSAHRSFNKIYSALETLLKVQTQAFILGIYDANSSAMDYENTIQHDEINLVRLVRRIEKSAAKEDEWKPRSAEPKEQIWLRVQKSLQVIRI